MAIHEIENFFCIRIQTCPSLPSNSDLLQNWSIVLAYLSDANHTARLYEPTHPLDCEEVVNRAVHAVSTLFFIPLKDPSSGLYIAHKVRPETREDIVLSALRKTKATIRLATAASTR